MAAEATTGGTHAGRTAALVGLGAACVAAAGSWHVSIWSDEVATLSAATRSFGDLLRLVSHLDAVHGTYYALMHIWVAAAGTSLMSLRLPSALAVGLAVSGTYLTARRLADHRTGVIAAAVLALLPRMTWAGIEARPFAVTTACVVWLTLALLVAVQDGRRAGWLAYGALLALGTALNLYVLLAAAAHAVTLLAHPQTRRRLLPWAIATGGGALLASPVVVTALGQGGQLGEANLGPVDLVRNVVVNQWFLGETPTLTTTRGGGLDLGATWKLAAVALALLCWLLVIRAVLARARATVEPTRDLVALALPLLVLPTTIVLAFALVSPPAYNPRYFAFSAPALALLVAAGLRASVPRIAVTATIAALALVAPVYLSQRTVTAKSGADLSLVAAHLDGLVRPGDAVYFGPRDDASDGVVLRSLRTVAIADPGVFDGTTDLTLLASPAEGATLFGTSAPLMDVSERLAPISTLWVIRREDRSAESAADDALLAGLGFHVDDTWRGPLTEVVRLSRD